MTKEQWLTARAERELQIRLANGAGVVDPRELLHAWLCVELKKPSRGCNSLALRAMEALVNELRPHYRKPQDWKDAQERVRLALMKHLNGEK